jgi:hypothetical protein
MCGIEVGVINEYGAVDGMRIGKRNLSIWSVFHAQ